MTLPAPEPYNWIADSVQTGLIVLDLQARICLFNRWMVKTSGLSWEQVQGRSLFEVFPEVSQGRIGLALKTCLSSGLPAVLSNSLNPTPFALYSTPQQRQNGERLQQSVRILRAPSQQGSSPQVLIEVEDVSSAVLRERRLQELNKHLMRSTAATQAALRDNHAMLSTLNQHAIVSVANRDGHILEVNEAFVRISGYTLHELQDQNYRIVNAGVHGTEFWANIWRDIASGKPWRGQICNRAKDDTLYWVDTFIAPFRGDDGRVEKFISICTDITQSKHAERELVQATQAAQAASQSKSQFLANMSHEIRTPMNAILGMLKLLHNTDLSPRQLDYASKSEGAAKSLLGLLNDILDFSKIDAGKMVLDPQPFRVNSLLRELSVLLSASVGRKPVEVLFDIDPAVPEALIGDPMRLQQVLVNLSSNAIKFTHQGDVVIQLRVLAQDEQRSTLRVAVRDSGIGIAPENQQRIFDGFSQAEASTTRRFGGTGLGLSISKRLVALMGGTLALESVVGQGSIFHFTITLPTTDHVPNDPDTEPRRQPGPLAVLVVDDNPVARDLMVVMAQSWGWQVDAARGGAEAIELVATRAESAQEPYQAIFMDWEMPRMDGWETIARIHQRSAQHKAPITIMVSARDRESLAQRSAEEQARLHAFLVKPVTPSMLFDAVAQARSGQSNLRRRPKSRAPRQGRLNGLRLLIVEDNLINQQVAQELLENEGALTELAENGQLGLDAITRAQRPFDAVLMDLQMPVMDGYTATHTIRHALGLLHLPVIAITANAMASDRAACLAAGMNDHIGKPFDLQHLVKVLLRHTRETDAPQPALPEEAPLPLPEALDWHGALARMGNNTALYRQALNAYLDKVDHLSDQLDHLFAAGELDAAARLLHTVKGLSATVGANDMAAVVRHAENEIRGADARFQHGALRARLRAASHQTVATLRPLAQGPADLMAPTPPAAQATQQLAWLDELLELLSRFDMRALDVHTQLRPTLAHDPRIELAALDAAMAALDFVQAAAHVHALRQQLHPRH